MHIHELKTLPEYFDAVGFGEKPFEVRKNDRGYQVEDVLMLRRWDEKTGYYDKLRGLDHGNYDPLFVEVTYLLKGGQFGIEEGYCVMGVQLLKRDEIESLLVDEYPHT